MNISTDSKWVDEWIDLASSGACFTARAVGLTELAQMLDSAGSKVASVACEGGEDWDFAIEHLLAMLLALAASSMRLSPLSAAPFGSLQERLIGLCGTARQLSVPIFFVECLKDEMCGDLMMFADRPLKAVPEYERALDGYTGLAEHLWQLSEYEENRIFECVFALMLTAFPALRDIFMALSVAFRGTRYARRQLKTLQKKRLIRVPVELRAEAKRKWALEAAADR